MQEERLQTVYHYQSPFVCECVCEREPGRKRERERDRERERERERERAEKRLFFTHGVLRDLLKLASLAKGEKKFHGK